MRIVPSRSSETIIQGQFCFTAEKEGFLPIEDCYQLKIGVPENFPREAPWVKEVGGKIPRDGQHHVNPTDDTLCLGSPLRLHFVLQKDASIASYLSTCLVPYLYAISYKLTLGDFPWGELDHGVPGVMQDYMELFGVSSNELAVATLQVLGKRKRVANKRPCPCGCGQRLGKCHFRWELMPFRLAISREWFRQHTRELRQ